MSNEDEDLVQDILVMACLILGFVILGYVRGVL